jgi:hypothetical protein
MAERNKTQQTKDRQTNGRCPKGESLLCLASEHAMRGILSKRSPRIQDPEIPDWTMQDIRIPDDGDAHAQPRGPTHGSRRECHGDTPRDDERECVICQEDKHGRWRALPCAHVFHEACVQEWLLQKPSCPVCRMTFPMLQAGHSGPGSRSEAWLGSTAVTVSDRSVSAMHQVRVGSSTSSPCAVATFSHKCSASLLLPVVPWARRIIPAPPCPLPGKKSASTDMIAQPERTNQTHMPPRRV